MAHSRINWNTTKLPSTPYTCGYCNAQIASEQGYAGNNQHGSTVACICLCHFCLQPTYFSEDGKQYPTSPFGNPVSSLPGDIEQLYSEARNTAMFAPTSSVLCSRKLLMHIAASKGAKGNFSFVQHVEHLSSLGYVPPDGKGWVDHIRLRGNEANHEIKIANTDEACELITFLEMLLKFIYEFPARVPQTTASNSPNSSTPALGV